MPKSQLFERLQVNHATTIPSRTSCSLVVTHFVPGTFLIGCLQQSYSFTAEMNLFFFSHQNEQFFIAKANNFSNVKTSTFSPRSSANRTGSDSTPIQGSAFRLIPVKNFTTQGLVVVEFKRAGIEWADRKKKLFTVSMKELRLCESGHTLSVRCPRIF